MRLIDSRMLPTALFACNDDMAVVAMDIFKNRGIRVPEDISIVGYDDIAIAAQVSPPLTTVKVPIYEMAKKAVDSVIDALQSGDKSSNLVSLPAKLVVRSSCMRRACPASELAYL